MTDAQKTELYLRRIGLDAERPLPPTAETLQLLQFAHCTHVPYENEDIVDGIPLSLDEDALFRKIVLASRGGYCFELNGLFAWLLRRLGFTVDEYFARFLRGENEIPMRRHRLLAVRVGEEKYICDVGIGQKAPRYPLLLAEGAEQTQFGERYRFRRDAELGWVLEETHHEVWRSYLSFFEEKQYPVDFLQPTFFCENHPSSPFRKVKNLSIKTPAGRCSLVGGSFKIFEGDTVVYEEEACSPQRLRELRREYFFLP